MTETEPTSDAQRSSEEGGASRASIRNEVWKRMRSVARPDSRFLYDFTSYIPDFPGSERFPEAIRELPFYEGSGAVFVTPDNCLELFRAALIAQHRPLLQTVAVAMGFHYIGPDQVPAGQERFAGTLDGAMVFGRLVDLDFVRSLGRLDFVVTGACAVSPRTGVRFGKGHGFFDLEWGILTDLGVVDNETPVVICVHDYQMVDTDLPVESFDTAGDWVVTPTRTVQVARRHRNPSGIQWGVLEDHYLEEIQPIRELKAELDSTHARPTTEGS